MRKIKQILSIMSGLSLSFAVISNHQTSSSAHNKYKLESSQPYHTSSKNNSGSFITVGGDILGCQFNNIQDAINSIPFSGTGEIRIATNKTYNENLIINDINVSLIGGYDDCFDAGLPFPPSSNQVLIDGGNNDSVIKVLGDFVDKSILLRNLRLIEGLGMAPSGESTGGGLLSYKTTAEISLHNLDIRNNDAEFGAGISIIQEESRETLLIITESLIINNLAKYGAGIYCSGIDNSPNRAEARIYVANNSGVVANVANGIQSSGNPSYGQGAGVYVNACELNLYSGSENDPLVGINTNFAFADGGGIYADNRSSLWMFGMFACNGGPPCFGNNSNPVKITGNVAGFTNNFGSGGGVYLKDFSSLRLFGSLIEGNSAKSKGGGVMLDTSTILADHGNPTCWNDSACNYFMGNISLGVPTGQGGSAPSHGGAIFSLNSLNVILSAAFEDNLATHGAAITLDENTHPFPSRSSLFLGSSLLIHNGDDTTESIIEIMGQTQTEVIHATIADNYFSDSAFDKSTFKVSAVNIDNTDRRPELKILSTIIDHFEAPVLKHNMTDFEVEIGCIIANETTSISSNANLTNTAENQPGGSYINQVIPGFIDRNNRNYHLSHQSQAIDYCKENDFSGTSASVINDIDHQQRGIDDPNNPDLSIDSLYDIGADESYAHEIIFSDGFE